MLDEQHLAEFRFAGVTFCSVYELADDEERWVRLHRPTPGSANTTIDGF